MWPVVVSVLIHATLFFILSLAGGDGDEKKEEKSSASSSIRVNIVDKPSEKKTEPKPPVPKNKSTIIVQQKKPLEQEYIDHKCDEWYGGIGVQYEDMDSGIISHVGKGYPADRAGIIVGDLVVDSEEIRGKPGTKVTVKIMRGSKLLIFNMIREKICTNEEKDE
jgi:predicted metalloprotease with PDZ domain